MSTKHMTARHTELISCLISISSPPKDNFVSFTYTHLITFSSSSCYSLINYSAFIFIYYDDLLLILSMEIVKSYCELLIQTNTDKRWQLIL